MTTTTAEPGQEPGNASTPGQEPTTTPTTPQAGKSQEDYDKIIADLRKENAAHRTKLKKFEDDDLARQQAQMGDLEKATARADAAEKQIKQYQEQLVHAEIKYAAQNKGIINPDLIADNIFKSLEFEDGKPTNLDKQLDELIKANPYLIKQQPGQQAAQTGLQKQAPQTPANNPGRGQIVQPGQLPDKQIFRLTDVYKRP